MTEGHLHARAPFAPSQETPKPPEPTPARPAVQQALSEAIPSLAARCTFDLNAPAPPRPPTSTGVLPTEYVVESLSGHAAGSDGIPVFRVHWYGYSTEDDSWEPAHHVDYNTVVRYCRRKHL